MEIKGAAASEAASSNVIPSNIVNNIISKLNLQNKADYDMCFGKDSFDRNNGFDKEGFDRWCV